MIVRSTLLMLLASVSFQATAQQVPHTTSHRDNATSALSISPIFSQLVAFKMPLSFHVVNEDTSAHAYIREAVPLGETADQWTQMITITGYKGIAEAPGLSPGNLASEIAAGYKKNCPDTFSSGGLSSSSIDGSPAMTAFAACGTVGDSATAHSEGALLMVIKGAQDYYTLQWAERGKAQSSPITFDQQHWVEHLKNLMPVFLCKKVPGEKPPYPSCTSRLPGDDDPAQRL